MVAVEGVSAACVVVVIVLVAIDQVVVVQVIKPTEREGRALMVAFVGVVEHNVQDHFDAGLVQRLHHVAEFGHVLGFARRFAISGVRRKIRHGRIAPEVVQLVAFKLVRFCIVELEDGQQFNCRHAKALQIGDLFDHRAERARRCDMRIACAGKATHVHFINHRILHRAVERAITFPVVIQRINHD